MPTTPNQKLKLLYLMRILLSRTDENHLLSMAQLIGALAEYGVQAERKSLYTDMDLLRTFGLDIEMRKSKTVGYYVASREFELPELKLLVDAVLSSRFITPKKSRALIQKISSLASGPQAGQLKRQVYVADRPKPFNESIYYHVDAIHTAINDGYQISFQYFDYDVNKQRVYRKGGEHYRHTPMALCWNDDKYYLICYSAKYDGLTHYRVDRMSDVSVSPERADTINPKRFNLARHNNQVFGMYSGQLVRATLRFDNSLVNAVLDRFGTEIPLHKRGDCFDVHVEVSSSPVLLSWVFQFGDKAQIIAPQSLRDTMGELLARQARLYVGQQGQLPAEQAE